MFKNLFENFLTPVDKYFAISFDFSPFISRSIVFLIKIPLFFISLMVLPKNFKL